jgi:hypothetical protein
LRPNVCAQTRFWPQTTDAANPGHVSGGYGFGGVLTRIETAEAAGPVLDPTLYREAGEKLAEVKALAEACKVFRDEVRRQAADKGEAEGNEDGSVRP